MHHNSTLLTFHLLNFSSSFLSQPFIILTGFLQFKSSLRDQVNTTVEDLQNPIVNYVLPASSKEVVQKHWLVILLHILEALIDPILNVLRFLVVIFTRLVQ